MLTLLRIRNLALFDSAEIAFGAGLTVLTGESGSGKSLILDALHLLAGASRPRLSVRTGQGSGFVEAEFQLARGPAEQLMNEELAACLGEAGFGGLVTEDEGPLVLTRRLESTGRSRCFVQGQTVSRTTLSRIASHLLEICGQSEAHHLRTPLAQLEAVDRFAGLSETRRKLGRWVTDLRELDALYEIQKKRLEESVRREDFIRYQLEELSSIDVESWEQAEVRLQELEHAFRSLKGCKEVVQLLGPDAKVLGQLKWLSARLGQDPTIDPRLSDQLELAVDALASCEKIALCSLEETDALKAELEELRSAATLLKELAGKHRVDVPALPERAETLRQELAELARAQTRFEALEQERTQLSAKVQELALSLHESRANALSALETKLSEELSRVGLKGAQFSAQVWCGELTASGVTQLELCFSANPGHPALPLSRVASGGELARILLAFRLATETTGSVLVFDEIDAGAGGRTAEKIAKSLGQASAKAQVLAVTHWPQVAGTARAHIGVEKRSMLGDTTSIVSLLDDERRLDELARMLGGNSETARSHAARLLKRVGDPPLETGLAPSPVVLAADRVPHEKRRRGGQCRIVAA